MLIFCTTVPAAPPGGSAQALDRCIASAAQGGREGLAELYRLTHAAVYGFALSIVKNAQDAEDVLQDVYLQVWQSAGSYRSQGKPMAWLLTIARNLSLSRLRAKPQRTSPRSFRTLTAARASSVKGSAEAYWHFTASSPLSSR